MRRMFRMSMVAVCAAAIAAPSPASAQWPYNFGFKGEQPPPGQQGSPNLHVLSHLPLGGFLHVAELEIEENPARPYVYVAKRFHPTGLDIISVADPNNAKVIWEWRIEDSELTIGSGALEPKYFKSKGRYYVMVTTQFQQGGPHVDLCGVVFDVTGLPDPKQVKEARRLYIKELPGGCHELFAYKHSDGRNLVVVTTTGSDAHIYDMDRFLAGDADQGFVGKIPIGAPTNNPERLRGYHDFYIGYDPATRQDKFYGAGAGGYYVFDITKPETPKVLFTLAGVQGVTYGHTFTPTPDGAFAVAETEYAGAPLRIFDLRPGQEGKVPNINRPIAFWTANYRNLAHNHEVRWPYVFVSSYEDGLQVFNMMDPFQPYTVGYYRTYDGPHESRAINNVNMGAWGVDVRNADGLIVVSDMMTGFWAFKMDGFSGWNGATWGMPNISSVQDWDHGPVNQARGVPVKQPVSAILP